MTINALLVIAGLIELILRFVILIVLPLTIVGIGVILIMSEDGFFEDFCRPTCWRLLETSLKRNK